MKPAYGEAAKLMTSGGVIGSLAAIDATIDTDLAQRFGIRGYPTSTSFAIIGTGTLLFWVISDTSKNVRRAVQEVIVCLHFCNCATPPLMTLEFRLQSFDTSTDFGQFNGSISSHVTGIGVEVQIFFTIPSVG